MLRPFTESCSRKVLSTWNEFSGVQGDGSKSEEVGDQNLGSFHHVETGIL